MARELHPIDYDLEYCAREHCGISVDRIAGVLAQVPGEADGPDWYWVVKFKEKGVYALISGGCDYSGWDCQSGGDAVYQDTAVRAAKEAPEEDGYGWKRKVRQTLLDQLSGKAPYALVTPERDEDW